MIGQYEETRRVTYNAGDANGIACFIVAHEGCGLFIKPDKSVRVHDEQGLKDEPNATCSKHGRVEMIFEGFFSEEDFA